MCGRYTLVTADHGQLARRFGAMMPASGGLERFNVAPTEDAVAVVNGKTGEREARLLRWSLVPAYAKDLKGPPMFNCRSETMTTKAPFKQLVPKPRNRCLILADGFYEFTAHSDPRSKRKHKWLFTLQGQPWFAIAGLWRDDAAVGEAFTMLTCPPAPDVAPYHDRSVVVLPPSDWAQWLDPATPSGALTRPLPAGSFAVAQVN